MEAYLEGIERALEEEFWDSSLNGPTCSRCGVKVAVVDHRDGRCLRCMLAAKAETRKQEAMG